jgi:hypothetical protein
MKQMSVLGFAVALVGVAIGGSDARANSLPAGTGFVSCATPSGGITDPVSCNGGADSGLVTYAPFAGVSGSANGQGLVDEAGLFGALNYSFEVIGGTVGDVVPIDIDASLQAIPNSIGNVFSEILVSAASNDGVTICNTGCADAATGFAGTLHVNALSGTVYTNAVHLEVDVIGALGNSFNGGMASADPYLFVDPSFLNAGEYSIEVSSNIGNVPEGGVPEPATWAMLLIGSAALLALRRRRTHSRCRGEIA